MNFQMKSHINLHWTYFHLSEYFYALKADFNNFI